MVEIKNLYEDGNYGNEGRLNIHNYFSDIALLVSQRSTCLRKHVGAVLVNNNKIVSTGYNGSVAGMAHCTDEGCIMRDGHCIRAIHAEQNAIIQLGKPNDYDNLELYVTDFPCQVCAKMIVNSGIKAVHFVRDYNSDDEFTNELFRISGIKLIKEFENN